MAPHSYSRSQKSTNGLRDMKPISGTSVAGSQSSITKEDEFFWGHMVMRKPLLSHMILLLSNTWGLFLLLISLPGEVASHEGPPSTEALSSATTTGDGKRGLDATIATSICTRGSFNAEEAARARNLASLGYGRPNAFTNFYILESLQNKTVCL